MCRLCHLLALFAAIAASQAQAQAVPRDPWVPPAVRAQAAAQPRQAPTRGAALAAQVERKLRVQFDAADAAHSGRISAAQARAAGLGLVAQHFDRIDTQQRGSVSFDEVRRYLQSRASRKP